MTGGAGAAGAGERRSQRSLRRVVANNCQGPGLRPCCGRSESNDHGLLCRRRDRKGTRRRNDGEAGVRAGDRRYSQIRSAYVPDRERQILGRSARHIAEIQGGRIQGDGRWGNGRRSRSRSGRRLTGNQRVVGSGRRRDQGEGHHGLIGVDRDIPSGLSFRCGDQLRDAGRDAAISGNPRSGRPRQRAVDAEYLHLGICGRVVRIRYREAGRHIAVVSEVGNENGFARALERCRGTESVERAAVPEADVADDVAYAAFDYQRSAGGRLRIESKNLADLLPILAPNTGDRSSALTE